MALDLGDARVGVAVSDPLGVTAQALPTIENRGARRVLEAVTRVVAEHDARIVVVGLPLLMSGEDGARATAAREFAEKLAAALPAVAVRLWDERLTTVQAERALLEGNVRRGDRRRRVDALAATVLLQSWLDARAAGAGAEREA